MPVLVYLKDVLREECADDTREAWDEAERDEQDQEYPARWALGLDPRFNADGAPRPVDVAFKQWNPK